MTYKWSNFNYGSNNSQSFDNNNANANNNFYGNQQQGQDMGYGNGFANNSGFGQNSGFGGGFSRNSNPLNNASGGGFYDHIAQQNQYNNNASHLSTNGYESKQYQGSYGVNNGDSNFNYDSYGFTGGASFGNNQAQQPNMNQQQQGGFYNSLNSFFNQTQQQEQEVPVQDNRTNSFRDIFASSNQPTNSVAPNNRPERVDFNSLFAPSGEITQQGEESMRTRRPLQHNRDRDMDMDMHGGRSRGSARYSNRGYGSRRRASSREDDYSRSSYRRPSSRSLSSSSLSSPYSNNRRRNSRPLSNSYSSLGGSGLMGGSSYGSSYGGRSSMSSGYSSRATVSSRSSRPLGGSNNSYRRRYY